jgi:hypothetical protein
VSVYHGRTSQIHRLSSTVRWKGGIRFVGVTLKLPGAWMQKSEEQGSRESQFTVVRYTSWASESVVSIKLDPTHLNRRDEAIVQLSSRLVHNWRRLGLTRRDDGFGR